MLTPNEVGSVVDLGAPTSQPSAEPMLTANPSEVGNIVDLLNTPSDPPPALGAVVGDSPDQVVRPGSFAPALSSNPGASHTLYLNFDGDYRDRWTQLDANGNPASYKNVKMYPFERTGLTPLTDAQRDQITEIWARVAEDYAPFDVNVTTVDPGNLDNGKTVMVDIGQSNEWFVDENGIPKSNAGTSSIGSFTDNQPNVVFDFIENIGVFYNDPTFAAKVADNASHEAGHSFGLLHHHVLNADGTLQNEYDPGSGNSTPIMGDTINEDTRHIWGIGMTGEVGTDAAGNPYDDRQIQVDSNVLGAVLGFRADDFGDDIAHATPLNMDGGVGTVNGIVGLRQFDLFGPVNRDVDVFSFDNIIAGQVTVRADVLGYHNSSNLNARIELWSGDRMIASAEPYDDQGNAQLSVNLAPGTYYVKVTGVGDFDAGQYKLTVQTPSIFGSIGTLNRNDFRLAGQNNGFAADTTTVTQDVPIAASLPASYDLGNVAPVAADQGAVSDYSSYLGSGLNMPIADSPVTVDQSALDLSAAVSADGLGDQLQGPVAVEQAPVDNAAAVMQQDTTPSFLADPYKLDVPNPVELHDAGDTAGNGGVPPQSGGISKADPGFTAINAKYNEYFGQLWFGDPLPGDAGLVHETTGFGRGIEFTKGAIYWSPATGAHVIWGDTSGDAQGAGWIRAKWIAMGGTEYGYPAAEQWNSPLGPTGTVVQDFRRSDGDYNTIVCWQLPNQPGANLVTYTNETNAVYGDIRANWINYGGLQFGLPLGDEQHFHDHIGGPIFGNDYDIQWQDFLNPQTGKVWTIMTGNGGPLVDLANNIHGRIYGVPSLAEASFAGNSDINFAAMGALGNANASTGFSNGQADATVPAFGDAATAAPVAADLVTGSDYRSYLAGESDAPNLTDSNVGDPMTTTNADSSPDQSQRDASLSPAVAADIDANLALLQGNASNNLPSDLLV
ncbi:MAG TPA: hypothetical protein VKS79_13215 [Gemmataceae bacterium]|nr:hypothetical protein [Gemmataceae bacterium]